LSPADEKFSALNDAEKRSKLRQLAQSKGSVTVWPKGSASRTVYRIREFERDGDVIHLHHEGEPPKVDQALLGSFELHGVSFFFKAQAGQASEEGWQLRANGEFYKSERRRNFRMLAFPLYEVHLSLPLGEGYTGGKVVDIQRRPGQTGLFRSFLKLVEAAGSGAGETEASLRVQDLSATGLSILLSEAELPWFRAGGVFEGVRLRFPDETVTLPSLQVVYVVDQIGDRGPKKFKAGLRFAGDTATEEKIAAKINALLREVDANRDFEDFIE